MLSLLQKACQGRRTAYSAHFTPFQEVFSEKHHASFAENARFFAEQGEDTSYPVRLLTVRAPAITKTHGISRSQAHLYRNKNLPMSTIQSSVKFRTLIVACYSHFFSGGSIAASYQHREFNKGSLLLVMRSKAGLG